MEKNEQTESGTVLHEASLLALAPRLTPTGKISHAKTRVYTQRYRTEWEQMPDFKGWLTSVPYQPTRAYCTYCKKNLHAHRLSLLKHTCTMKHQRAALLHEAEEKKKAAALNRDVMAEVESEEVEGIEIQTIDTSQPDVEENENEDEIEYVVERLDTDDELEEPQLKEEVGCVAEMVEDEEDEEDEDEEEEDEEDEDEELHLQMSYEEQSEKPLLKKMKMDAMRDCRGDPLAEAMVHVHGEYLEETENQENVQVEMVVESEEQHQEMQVVTVISESEETEKELSKETRENGRSIRRGEGKIERKSGKMGNTKQGDTGIVMACPLPILGTSYQINSTVGANSTIGVLQPVNAIPIAPAQSKTITLTSGGKTLTLTGGTFQPGTQYVLSKLKGKLPTLVVADKKTGVAVSQGEDAGKGVQSKKENSMAVASTSQQSPKKPSTPKKPRISTHVLDMSKGLPVGGLQVSLYKLMDGRWTFLNESNTSPSGRCVDLVDNTKVNFTAGRYKIHFDVDKYFTLRRIETMYPFIEIVFDVKNPTGHYHIPVLLSPFGYTTYRGSER